MYRIEIKYQTDEENSLEITRETVTMNNVNSDQTRDKVARSKNKHQKAKTKKSKFNEMLENK